MKHRINLYHQEFRPVVSLISLNFVVACWLVAIAVIVSLYVGANGRLDKISGQMDALHTEVESKKSLIRTLQQARDNRGQDPQLLSDIEVAQEKLSMQKAVLDELAARETQKSRGFSALMLDLARHHQSNLWLTEIVLNDQQLRIQGGTFDSASVPVWVNKLSDTRYFVGRAFAEARLFRDEEEQLHFVLSSELTEGSGRASGE